MTESDDWSGLVLAGGDLTEQQCVELENTLQANPNDLDIRVQLLGNYFQRQIWEPKIAKLRSSHVLWFIENRPEHPIAGSPYTHSEILIDSKSVYNQLKQGWIRNVQATGVSPQILSNAAWFFSQHDKVLAEKCLLQAAALAPDDYDFIRDLAALYHIWKRPKKQRATCTKLLSRELDEQGFGLAPFALEKQRLCKLLSDIETNQKFVDLVTRKSGVYAIRHLLADLAVNEFARSSDVIWLAQAVIGRKAFPVRAILLDKKAGAKWRNAWHQDATIAVTKRIDTPGFGPWSLKRGIHHVQPPREILEQMVALRFHFDDNLESDCELEFIAGSHRHGILDQTDIDRLKNNKPITGYSNVHSVLLMYPLILHSSSESKMPMPRRILHIEYASCDLPNGLEWAIA